MKGAAAAVWTAHSEIGALAWHFILAVDVPAPFPLLPDDLWAPPRGAVAHRRWHATRCADGGAAAACGVAAGLPDAQTGVPPAGAPLGAHRWELYTVSPVTAAGVALLGEVAKVVAVSPVRFRAVTETAAGGLRADLVGSAGEAVDVAFLVGDIVCIRNITFPTSGTASITMSPE